MSWEERNSPKKKMTAYEVRRLVQGEMMNHHLYNIHYYMYMTTSVVMTCLSFGMDAKGVGGAVSFATLFCGFVEYMIRPDKRKLEQEYSQLVIV